MDVILSYFPHLSEIQKNRFSRLFELYSTWNSRINVISRKDIEFLYEHHVLHSLSIAKFFKFVPGTRIMDVGTGGGFPAIPLAIFFPETDFIAVDSIGKKIKVVEAITSELCLSNIKPVCIRAETIDKKFDFVVSRAVSSLPALKQLIRNKISLHQKNTFPNGLICLKGGDVDKETKPYRDSVKIYSISDVFKEEYFKTKKIVYLFNQS